jgi:hypothetical protein
MTVKARQRVERLIARRLILDALRAGYTLSVFDGEEITVQQSAVACEILRALFTTDEDWLLFSRPGDPPVELQPGFRPTVNAEGWVRLVYGNDGFDVISDYTTNLETVLAGANKLADRYAA